MIKKTLAILGNLIKYLILLGIVGILLSFLAFYPTLSKDWDQAKKDVALSSKDTFYPDMASRILDKDGNVLAVATKEYKIFTYLDGKDIPKWTKQAFISIEDRTFYKNKGLDLKGQTRVLLRFALTGGKERHGASTITQQLAKMTFLSPEQTISRKVKEMFYAYELTKHYSKEDILTFYINNCCFANNIYGIEKAANVYFGKPAKDLTLGETAYLCAIPNSPSYYDPWKNKDNAIKRQRKILNDMAECGFITASEKAQAEKEPIQVQPKQESAKAFNTSSCPAEQSFAIHCAVEELMRENGFTFQSAFPTDDEKKAYDRTYKDAYTSAKERLYKRRYTIQTAIDPAVYQLAQGSLDKAMSSFPKTGDNGLYSVQSAMAVYDNNSGKIIATVGGRSQENGGSFDRSFQSYRQPGSTMKPLFVYAPAIDRGYNRASKLTNVTVSVAKHSKNVLALGGAPVDLYTALIRSMNGPAYWLSAKIGVSSGMDALSKMYFGGLSPEDNSLSTALGGMTYGTNPVEMASAYSTFTNQGYYRFPTCVTGVLDMNGTNIYEEPDEVKVYSRDTVDQMADLMKGVLTEGTARKAGPIEGDIDSAGKTGTTNSTKDVWFTGYTPYYTASVWMGRDDAKSMDGQISSVAPAYLWKDVMQNLVNRKQPAHFEAAGTGKLKVNLTIPHENEPLPYYFSNEVIQQGYTVKDYRDDIAMENEVLKKAKAFKGTDQDKNDFVAELTRDMEEIQNTNTRSDTRKQLSEIFGNLNDKSLTEVRSLNFNSSPSLRNGSEVRSTNFNASSLRSKDSESEALTKGDENQ
ncbi:transglycosylase domain-containing protein [Lachnospiraceae bacterium YH-ros2228]